VTIQMKAVEQYFHLVLFIMLHRWWFQFNWVDEIIVSIEARAVQQYFHIPLLVMLLKHVGRIQVQVCENLYENLIQK